MKLAFFLTRLSFFLLLSLLLVNANAQYKSFQLSSTGDTLNIVDNKGLKQGKWVTSIPEIRGEPGYDEEGLFKNDKKEGVWRRYTAQGDIIAVENYRFGGKDGLQQYFTFLGDLEREEQWRSYNPDAHYDTIPVYGADNNQILNYKIVKAEQYSVPNGEWKYYEGGNLTKVEHYDRGYLVNNNTGDDQAIASTDVPTAKDSAKKAPVKTPEMLEYEKKYSKKKRQALERTGETGPE